MSLIPSESYSFPDHFTTTRAASRRAKKVEPEPEAEAIEPRPEKPAIVALPNPERHPQPAPAPAPLPVVAENNSAPVRIIGPPVPNPALRRATAPPPRISEQPIRKIALPPSLKPKVRWNNRAPAMNPVPPVGNNGNGNGSKTPVVREAAPVPAQNVIQMRPPPAPPPVLPKPGNLVPNNARPVVQPNAALRPEKLWSNNPPPTPPIKPVGKITPPVSKPARPVQAPQIVHTPPAARPQPETPQSDFFEMFAESNETVVRKRRLTEKMRRFIFCESIAVAVFLPLAAIGLLFQPQNPALHWILNVFTISAAVAAALIPIIFFAATPTLPEIER